MFESDSYLLLPPKKKFGNLSLDLEGSKSDVSPNNV